MQIPDGFLLLDGMVAEYRATVTRFPLPLPVGFRFPDLPPHDPRPDMLYQEGCGEVAALFAWLVGAEAAVMEAIDEDDPEATLERLELAARFSDNPIFARRNDHTAPVSWHDMVIVPALAGDFSCLAADLAFNRGEPDPASAGVN